MEPTETGTYRWLRWVVLATLAVAVALALVWTRHWRMVNDAAQLDYCVFMVDHGFAPYRQMVEMNMPGIYLANWTVMHTLGGGDVAWHVFDDLLLLAMMAAMVAITWPLDWMAGVFGGVFFALFHARDGAGQMGQRDEMIGVLMVAAFAFLFHAMRRGRVWPMFAFGLLMAAAATIKPTPAPFALVVLVFAVVRWHRLGHGPTWRPLLAALVGMAVPAAVVLAWLLRHNSLAAFVHVLRVWLPFYAPLARADLLQLGLRGFSPSARWLLGLAGLLALCWRQLWKDWEYGMVLLGSIVGLASYYIQHKGFTYHRYPMLAFLFLWAAITIFTAFRQNRLPWLRAGAAITMVFGAVTCCLYAQQASTPHWPELFTSALTADLDQLGGAQQLQGQVQCLYTMAECDTVLYRMKIVQATGLMYDFFLFARPDHPVTAEVRQRFWNEILARPPRVIVVGRGAFPAGPRNFDKLNAWPQFVALLNDRYELRSQRFFPPDEGGPLGYQLYVLRRTQAAAASHPSGSSFPFSRAPHLKPQPR